MQDSAFFRLLIASVFALSIYNAVTSWSVSLSAYTDIALDHVMASSPAIYAAADDDDDIDNDEDDNLESSSNDIIVMEEEEEDESLLESAESPEQEDESQPIIIPNVDQQRPSASSPTNTNGTNDEIVMEHFFSHIPKSGATYSMHTVMKLVRTIPQFKALPKEERFRVCDQATVPVKMFKRRYLKSYKGIRCTLWMSEDKHGYKAKARNRYVILRKPKAHVLSQYFHCKESRDHKTMAKRMPSLDEWLETWAAVKDGILPYNATNKFMCYKPLNKQSDWTHVGEGQDSLVDKTYAERKQLLKNRYTILGDQAQMSKTTCAIATRFSGWVPPQCNCTNARGRELPETTTTAQKEAGPAQGGPQFAHGVKHHGATFETTDHQNELIAKITDIDEMLYEVGQEVFQEQVQAIETEYQVKLCDEIDMKM